MKATEENIQLPSLYNKRKCSDDPNSGAKKKKNRVLLCLLNTHSFHGMKLTKCKDFFPPPPTPSPPGRIECWAEVDFTDRKGHISVSNRCRYQHLRFWSLHPGERMRFWRRILGSTCESEVCVLTRTSGYEVWWSHGMKVEVRSASAFWQGKKNRLYWLLCRIVLH